MLTDAELLRRYVEVKSETAFTDLVERYVDLVYTAAFRQMGNDAHRARDVAQVVFTLLAQKASNLTQHPVLEGWLYTSTHFAAQQALRADRRRQAREQKAYIMHEILASDDTPVEWEHVRPVLDEIMSELSMPDREAVVLRYFTHRSFTDIGAALNVSEDAARMRVDRALEKLRSLLAKRGVTSTVALSTILADHAVAAAPIGTAASLASVSLATANLTTGLSAVLIPIMTKKIVALTAVGAVVFFALGSYFGPNHWANRSSATSVAASQRARLIDSLREQNAVLRNEMERLKRAREERSSQEAAAAASTRVRTSDTSRNAPTMSVGAQQRAILDNLRRLSVARDSFERSRKRPPASIDDLVGEMRSIRKLVPIDGEDYSGLSLIAGQSLTVTTAHGVVVTYEPSGLNNLPLEPLTAEEEAVEIEKKNALALLNRVVEESRKIQPFVRSAITAYRAVHNGTDPPSPNALVPYFATAQEGADYLEVIELQRAAASAQAVLHQ